MCPGMFQEKADNGSARCSMTRAVAFLFAVVYSAVLIISSQTSATSMGWPFAALGIVVVLAVPLQALFKTLQTWFATPPGKKTVAALIEKALAAVIPGSGGTSVTTTVESGEPG